MQTLWQDIRYAIRMLTKNAAFSFVAILSLALGIGANTTIFTVVNAILLNPLPVKNVSRVVEVDTVDSKARVTGANAVKLGMSYMNFQDYARQTQLFSATTCVVGPLPLTWSGGADPRQLQGQMVSASYFDIWGLIPASGRFFLPDEDTKPGGNNVAVLSYSLWTNKFGANPNMVGQILTLNATPYSIIRVAPRGFKGTFTFNNAEEVWIPVSMYPQVLVGFFKNNFNTRRFLATIVYGRLKDGVSQSSAEASLKTVAAGLESAFPADNTGRSVALTPLPAVLIGVAPALKAARPILIEVLKVGGRGNTVRLASNPFRSMLVVNEIALALVALVGAGLFIRSMQNAQRIDPGFESTNLFMFNFDLGALHYDEGHGQQFFRAAIERAKASPGVESATIADAPPLIPAFSRTIFPEGQDEASGYRGTLTQVNDIASTFFETLRIPLIAGREFTDSDRATTKPVAIANEAMAKHFWPNENVVGKRFHFHGDPTLREIVGVVRSTVVNNIGEEPQPVAYLPLTQNYSPTVIMQVRTSGRPEALISTVRAQVQSLDSNLALTNVQTIGELLSQGLWAPRMGAALLAVFGALALILAIIGVYGVLSYSVNQQTREIGIRMAMGAQTGRVLRLVVGQGMRLAAAGLALGLLVAFAAMRLLGSLLFGVSAHDPLTFGAVSLVLALAAVLACYIPARRATKVDPIIALRYE